MATRDIYEVNDYRLTGDPELADHKLKYSAEIEEILQEAYFLAQKAKPQSFNKLSRLIERYPHIPAFKNYLMVFYANRGKADKARAMNERIVREHPDYLHGKLNLASSYIDKEQYDKALEILGETLELKYFYPNREVFHFNEFESYNGVVIQYLTATDRLDEAADRLDMLEKAFPSSVHIPQLRMQITSKRMSRQLERRRQKMERWAAHPIGRTYDKDCQTDEPPQLQHPELLVLYQQGLEIPEASLRNLLTLPRISLIDDLKTILWDSVRRFEHFVKEVNESKDGWDDDQYSFPLHAQFLLTELRAKETLPFLLECISQGKEYLEFWYGDHIFETLWHFIYHLGLDQLEALKAFVLQADIHYNAKTIVAQALTQIGLHQPKRVREVLDWYESVLNYFLDHPDEELLIDPDAITLLTANLLDLPGSRSLLPLVSRFYDLQLIDETVIGDLEEVKDTMQRREEKFSPMPVYEHIFDHYHHITTKWYGYMSAEEQERQDALFREKMPEIEERLRKEKALASSTTTSSPVRPADQAKVGRNAPCPCGSGKKYKKCCWGKA
jgi:tetratricopeptide (TPR) repeat protein